MKLVALACCVLLAACASARSAPESAFPEPRGTLAETIIERAAPGAPLERSRPEPCSPPGDPRPECRLITRSGVFSGYYTRGFETSEFVPCPSDNWAPSDSRGTPYDWPAWVVWTERSLTRTVTWPPVERDRNRNPRYFVRWQGTVDGPGRYGHMGVSSFQFQVDELLEVRAPSATDCRR